MAPRPITAGIPRNPGVARMWPTQPAFTRLVTVACWPGN